MEGNNKQKSRADEIRKFASAFIQKESNYKSMITITNVIPTKDFKKVTFFVTVFPENQENAGIDFLMRNRKSLKDYLKKYSRMSRIPQVEFALDGGEKSRQRIDDISREVL